MVRGPDREQRTGSNGAGATDRAHQSRSPLSLAASDGVNGENRNPHSRLELNRIPDSHEANRMS